MNEERMKKHSHFGKGLVVYILILTLLFAGTIVVLWRYLAKFQREIDTAAAEKAAQVQQAEYEKNVARAPQLAFETYVATATAEDWAESWLAANPGSFDDPAKVRARMEELFSGEDFAMFKAQEYSAQAPVYVLKNGSQPLATLKMSGSELDWSVSEITMLIEGGESASLAVPEGCTVYCNGTALDAGYVTDVTTDLGVEAMKDYSAQLVNPIHTATYGVSGQLFPPTLTAEAPADKTLRTAADGSFSYVLAGQNAKEYQEQGKTFTEKMLVLYMQGGAGTYGHAAAAQECVVMNSQAYKLIASAAEGVTWNPAFPNATYQVTPGECTVWADNCVSVDVAYHAEGSADGQTKTNDGIYRIFFLDTGKGFGICALENIYE